jgi:Protein of unknown function (DUF3631)
MKESGPQIVSTLEATFRKYMALDPGLPLVLAVWALATHVFECFDTFPYLAITSPTKRCGKTRLAEIIELLAARGERLVNPTQAVIFRTIQSMTPTLIIDEAEALSFKSDRSEAIREILNAGYRAGQFVSRCDTSKDGSFEPQKFKTYCPKVLVLIGNLPDTLADRCIPIRLRRRRQGERVERFFFTRARWGAKQTQKQIKEWALAHRNRVKRQYRGRDLTFLEDREAELWLPLFAVCRVAAPERVEELKPIALHISRVKQADEPAQSGLLLLSDIREIFTQARSDRMPTVNLLLDLSAIEESELVARQRSGRTRPSLAIASVQNRTAELAIAGRPSREGVRANGLRGSVGYLPTSADSRYTATSGTNTADSRFGPSAT